MVFPPKVKIKNCTSSVDSSLYGILRKFALLISRYILRLGQAAQKQQRPRCPNSKMYLEIRRADRRLFKVISFQLALKNFSANLVKTVEIK